MKVHSDTQCLVIDARVARLEAASAAKDAALRAELARHVQDGHWGTVTEPKPETCGRCADMVAALSDTGRGCRACGECGLAVSLCTCVPALRKWPAGEGWLPPEVREQARKALQAWFDWENDGTGQADTTDYDEEGAGHLQLLMIDTRAALDALEVT